MAFSDLSYHVGFLIRLNWQRLSYQLFTPLPQSLESAHSHQPSWHANRFRAHSHISVNLSREQWHSRNTLLLKYDVKRTM